ncbi:MAG: hypothetical protein LBB04_00475 [Oscillospiraceae bacterium]|jgi:hypothetical protein|nr:hypothetical protein [Oscillospiraceae bacterium]
MSWFSDMVGKVKKGASSAWKTVKKVGGDAFGAAKKAFGGGKLLGGGLKGAFGKGRNALSAGWDSARGGINEATGGAFDKELGGLESVGTGFLDKIQGKIGDFSNSKNGGLVDSIMQIVGGLTGN